MNKSIFALTRYVIDADPHGLVQLAADDILSISDYALAVQHAGIDPGEKVSACGSRNLIGEDLGEWQAQMLAVAASATQVQIPVLHLILSLHEEESWTEDQREEAISIVLNTLGLQRCQVIWAEHSNTKNAHLHLAILRVDPMTVKAAGTEWLIDDLHQAMAIIEERQGRVREQHALYVARAGAVYDVETDALVRDIAGQYLPDWYKAAGKKRTYLPPELVRKRAELIEAAVEAASWEELHDLFRELGAAYDKAGSGGRIKVGSATAKASELHPSLSRRSLEKSFGEFVADAHRLDPAYESYRQAFDAQLSTLRQSRDECGAVVNQWLAARIAGLPGSTRKLESSGIRVHAERATKKLRAAFKHAIQTCTQQRLTHEKWIEAGRPRAPEAVPMPCLILPSGSEVQELTRDVSTDLQTCDQGGATEYRDKSGEPVFTDYREIIVVHAITNEQVIDAALRISHERWGTVRLTGPATFLELASQRAAILGINVIDADGKPLLPTQSMVGEQSDHARAASNQQQVEAPPGSSRKARVEVALRFLGRYDYLPIRRRLASGDTETSGRTGSFELIVGNAGDRAIEDCSIFDQDKSVQEFLRHKHDRLIADCEEQLLERCAPHMLDDRPTVQLALSLSPRRNLAPFAAIASEDAEFLTMLQRVREQLLARKKERKAVTPVQQEVTVSLPPATRDVEYEQAVQLAELEKARKARGR